MKKLIPTLTILILLPSLTFAQSISDDSLRECLVLEGLAERLICYDTLAEGLSESGQVNQVSVEENHEPDKQISTRPRAATDNLDTVKSSSGSWSYNKSVDNFDDSTNYWLYNTALSKNTGYDHDDVYLVIGCLHKFKKLVFAVNWDTFLGSEGDQIETVYRIGSRPAERMYWRALDGIADFSATPDIHLELLNELINSESERFLVKTEAYSRTVTAEFNLSGLSEILNQILTPCGY